MPTPTTTQKRELKNQGDFVPKSIPPGQSQLSEPQPGVQSKMSPSPVSTISPQSVSASSLAPYKASGKLEGKKALITGGDSGIGRAVAALFAMEGADVAIVYVPGVEEEDAKQTKQVVEESGRKFLGIAQDISSEQACRAVIDQTVAKFGKIDILVNNAAIQELHSMQDVSFDTLEAHFRVNVFAAMVLTKYALEHIPDETGCVINTTSVVGFRGSPSLPEYSATKGALTAFTKTLALQLKDRKIRVNAVAPGPVHTPLQPTSRDDKNLKEWVEKGTPLMGRIAQPSEIAPAYVFLASQADSAILSGQTVHPNGGEFLA